MMIEQPPLSSDAAAWVAAYEAQEARMRDPHYWDPRLPPAPSPAARDYGFGLFDSREEAGRYHDFVAGRTRQP